MNRVSQILELQVLINIIYKMLLWSRLDSIYYKFRML